MCNKQFEPIIKRHQCIVNRGYSNWVIFGIIIIHGQCGVDHNLG